MDVRNKRLSADALVAENAALRRELEALRARLGSTGGAGVAGSGNPDVAPHWNLGFADLLPDAAYILIDGRIVAVNAAGVDQLGGNRPEDIIGRNTLDFIHPDHHPQVLEHMDRGWRLGGGTDLARLQKRRLDGSDYPAEVYTACCLWNDTESTLVVVRDITGRVEAEKASRDSEARFRELAESLPEIVAETDARGLLTFLNRRGMSISGYDEDDLKNGLHALDLVVPEDRDKVRQNMGTVMDGQDLGHNEYTGLRKDGTTYPVTVHSNPIYRDGELAGLSVTVLDITERKEFEEELIRRGNEAEAANRAKTHFLAAMSHELRTPLNAIIGFSETMRMEAFGPLGNEHYIDYAEDIRDSGYHLLALINDILDLAKVESGKDELNEETVNVAQNARSAMTLVRQRAETRGVTLALELEGDLPALWVDPRKLRQILTNLLTNAIKFTDRGGRITLVAGLPPDGGLLFEVSDNGIGIAAEDIPKALSQFGQVSKGPEYAQEGTGLGLPLTNALIGQHGGSLDLESEPGVGTTVRVFFPEHRLRRNAGGLPRGDMNPRRRTA